jgi:hypothetical protein
MIKPIRVTMLALAIVVGLGGFTLSAMILAIGSVLLHPWDDDE